MKNMRGRILRKLKSISTPYWMPGQVFQTNTPIQVLQTSVFDKEHPSLPTLIGDSLNLSEGFKVVEEGKDEETASCPNKDGQEKLDLKPDNFATVPMHDDQVQLWTEFDRSVNTSTTVVMERTSDSVQVQLPGLKLKSSEESDTNHDKVEDNVNFPSISDKCPSLGKESVILYTTSLRGIRKTFEDCNTIRFLLESFRIVYYERDVSMHLEYRDELWRMLDGRVIPPKLFIRGRYIGGADEVLGLHETGMLRNLIQGIPLNPSNTPCQGCAGMRFVMCCTCNGSRKVMPEGQNAVLIKCPDCNENGLAKCLVCS